MKTDTNTKPGASSLNKPAYVILVTTGIFFLVVRDFSQAAIFWGLALVFDPFDQNVSFQKRPGYQKAWLFVHAAITLALFVIKYL
jgi:hypothetical protein